MYTRRHEDPKVSERFMDETLKLLESKGKAAWRLTENENEIQRLNR